MSNADILSQDRNISSSGVFISEHPSSGLPCLSYSLKSIDPKANGVIVVLANFQHDVSFLRELHRVISLVSGLEASGALEIDSSGGYRGRLLTGNGYKLELITELDIEPFVPLRNIGVARTGVLERRQFGISKGFGGCEILIKVPKDGSEIGVSHNLSGVVELAVDFVRDDARQHLLDQVIVVAREPYKVAQALRDMREFNVVVGKICDDAMHDPRAWPKPTWRAWVHADAEMRATLMVTTDDRTGREIPLELKGLD